MRRALLLLTVTAALASPGYGAEVLREQSRKTIPSQGLSLLSVHNSRGRIEARRGGGESIVITAVKIVRGSTMEKARDAARQTQVLLERDGDRYEVRVRYPKGTSVNVNLWDGGLKEINLPRTEVRLSVDVPPGLGLELEASSGDVRSEGVAGPQLLRTASGEVVVEGAEGSLQVRTSSGDVEVAAAAGSVRASTTSGDVELSGVRGAVAVMTSSGDVEVGEALDSLRVETTSGDVVIGRARRGATVRTSSGQVQIRRVAGAVAVSTVSGEVQALLGAPVAPSSVTTSSGDVRLGLDPGVACTLDLSTSSGSIDMEIPARSRSVSRQHLTAVVGAGGSPVSLRSASGSITVGLGEP